MITRRYHRDIFLPAELLLPFRERQFRLAYTKHAQSEVFRDFHLSKVARSNRGLSLPHLMYIDPATVFEAESIDGKLSKIGIRLPFDATDDLILVLSPGHSTDWQTDTLNVRTLWTNSIKDSHVTLDQAKYEPAP